MSHPADPTDPTRADAADESTPATPKPRSATSRARRIGGAGSAGGARPASTPAPTRPSSVSLGKAPEPAQAAPGRVPATGSSAPAPPAAESQPARPADPAGSSGRGVHLSLPGWAVWAPAVALATAAVVFLVLFLVARTGGSGDIDRSAETRDKVLAAAKTCIATLNTYRYDQLPTAEAAGVKCTTGRLTTDYKRTVDNIIKKNAPALQAIQQAKITTAGIESVTGNGTQYTVLAYGTLAITTAKQKQGRQEPFAVVARLQQVGDAWLLSKVDTVSSFSA